MNRENQHIDPIGLLPKIFSGEATPEEKEWVTGWLSEDPVNRTEYNSFLKLWNYTATVPSEDEIDIGREWEKMNASIETVHGKSFRLNRILQIAASILAITALTFLGIRMVRHESVRSASSSLAATDLKDGTHITLNAGSKISYDKGFGITNRNISLKGEAYFDVSHSAIPFVINAGEATIRVTGTAFNVKAYSGKPQIRVTVTEGTVTMYKSEALKDEISIHEGETGMYDRAMDQLVLINTVDVNDMAWKTRILDFHNTPLAEVADILSSTYHIPVKIDTALGNCSVTVRFENQDADAVLNVLKSTLNLTVTKKGKKIIITGKGC